MKARSRFVLFAGKQVDSLSATNLGKAFYDGDAVKVIPFHPDSDSFKFFDKTDLNEILILGHGSKSTLGGLTAEAFASDFNQQFEKQFQVHAKSFVHDIFIISSEIGFIDAKGDSLAQRIIDNLHAAGFINARVHAYGYMATIDDRLCELNIEVINNVGIQGYVSNIKQLKHPNGKVVCDVGYISAQLHHLKNNKTIVLLEGANPKEELATKQQNIFLPLEKMETRLNRIANEVAEQKRFTRQNVILLLKRQRNHLRKKGKMEDNIKAILLKSYITRLSLRSDDNWKSELNCIIEHAGKQKMIFNKHSTTLKLLRHIGNEDIDEIDKLHAEQAGESIENNNIEIVMSRDSESDDYDKILKDVSLAIDKLQKEIQDLKSSVFANLDFIHEQIKVKQSKLEVLQSIIKAQDDFVEVYRIADNRSKSQTVTMGRSSRTSAILMRIIDLGGEDTAKRSFMRSVADAYK